MLGEDPELGSAVLGMTTGSDEPATEDGIDPTGDDADATSDDGGPDLSPGVEPDLNDAATAASQPDPPTGRYAGWGRPHRRRVSAKVPERTGVFAHACSSCRPPGASTPARTSDGSASLRSDTCHAVCLYAISSRGSAALANLSECLPMARMWNRFAEPDEGAVVLAQPCGCHELRHRQVPQTGQDLDREYRGIWPLPGLGRGRELVRGVLGPADLASASAVCGVALLGAQTGQDCGGFVASGGDRCSRLVAAALVAVAATSIRDGFSATIDSGVQVYFCDPKSPWQRGSNENTNGLLRQYFPRRSDMGSLTQERLDAVAAELNGRPRQTLDWMSPAERLAQLLSEIPAQG
jgi:hypothetical protein